MSRRKIKNNKTKVRRPRGAHARNMDVYRRAMGRKYLADLVRPVKTDKNLNPDELEAAMEDGPGAPDKQPGEDDEVDDVL